MAETVSPAKAPLHPTAASRRPPSAARGEGRKGSAFSSASLFPGQGRDRTGGFTLVELLVVLVILSLVMGLVGPRVLSYLSSSRERAARLQLQSFSAALDLYYLDMGRYPTTSEGLQSLVKAPAGQDKWAGPYVQQGAIPADPWGNPYEYKTPGRTKAYGVTSLGSDGRRGGENDAADIVID